MGIDGRCGFVDSRVFFRRRLEHRGTPSLLGAQVQHDADIRHHFVRPFPIRFVHQEDVRNLHDSGLHDLHVVSHAGDQDQADRVGDLDDVDLRLADPHRLDEDDVLAAGVQNQSRLMGCPADSPQGAPGAHAADEHVRVQGVVLHAQPISQDGPPGKGT